MISTTLTMGIIIYGGLLSNEVGYINWHFRSSMPPIPTPIFMEARVSQLGVAHCQLNQASRSTTNEIIKFHLTKDWVVLVGYECTWKWYSKSPLKGSFHRNEWLWLWLWLFLATTITHNYVFWLIHTCGLHTNVVFG